MLIKSSHRTNGYSIHEKDSEEVISGKEEESDEEEYLDKLHNLTSQLKQLNEKSHPDICKAIKSTDAWLEEQHLRIQILHDAKIDEVHSQYAREIQTCDRDCGIEKRRIQEYLISLCEGLKHRLEHDKKNLELTASGDVLELKPTVTRKLRRRTPEVPSPALSVGKFGYWDDVHNLYGAPWTLPKTLDNGGSSLAAQLSPSRSTATWDGDENGTAAIVPPSITHSCSGNQFGSLGVNVEDGSLVTHLLASLNAAATGGIEGASMSSSGALFAASGLCQSVGLSNLLTAGSSINSSVVTVGSPIAFGVAGGSTNVVGNCALQPAKRKKQQNSQPFTQLALLLPENDIYSDLTTIHRACGKPPSSTGPKKHGTGGSTSSGTGDSSSRLGATSPSSFGGRGVDSTGTETRRKDHHGYHHQSTSDNLETYSSSPTPTIWIDDGRLYSGQVCFQQGSTVYLDGHGVTGTIVSIGAQDISIKRNSDHGIIRITVQQLKHGRYNLVPLKRR